MSEPELEATPSRGLTRSHKLLLALAGVFLLAGGALALLAGDEPQRSSALPVGAGSLTAGGSGSSVEAESDPLRPWSTFFLKGGGGFLMGFCLGYAARSFLKLSAMFVGVVLLAVFGLHAAGIVEVDFPALEGLFDRVWNGLREQLSAGRSFLEGNLSAAGTAGVGLFTGLRRT